MIFRLLPAGVLAAAALLPGVAGAQSDATLSGIVLDPFNHAVADATVTVEGNGVHISRTSDSGGRFVFAGLPIGTYSLRATHDGQMAALTLDVPEGGTNVAVTLLRTIALNRIGAGRPVTTSSGTDLFLNQTQLAHLPASGSLPSLLLQLPGAARGADGVVHINGDHGDVNYVVDGVPIPQALNREVGSEFDSSDIAFMDVMEGAYPAEYGGRFAAVINIDTRAANGPPSASASLSGGSFGTYDSQIHYGTPVGNTSSLWLGIRNERSDRELDPPNPLAVHDAGSNSNQFLRFTSAPDPRDVLIFAVSHSYRTYEIPNDVNGGEPSYTNDAETQDDTFANIRFSHALRADGSLSYGIAFKESHILDLNDPVNDFIYGEALNIAAGGHATDCAQALTNPAVAFTPLTCAYSLYSGKTARDLILDAGVDVSSTRHTVKYGFSFDATNVAKDYRVTLQPGNFLGGNTPYTVADDAPNTGHTEGVYLQDGWRMGDDWRVDYGIREDAFALASSQFDRGYSQLSPRLRLTRLYGDRADAYIYAARFFTPFSFENVSPTAAQKLNEPLQSAVAQFDLKPQRDTDVEIGGHLPLGSGVLGLRVMQKIATDPIDDTQVGVTPLHQDINYTRGNISSQSAYYQQSLSRAGRFYVSLTHTRSVNKGCETQLLAPCFGSPADWTPADHDQRWDASAGLIRNDERGGWLSLDGEYGSGLSSAICVPVNPVCKTPPHLTFDVEDGIATGSHAVVTIRAGDILNDRYWITHLNAQGNHYNEGRTIEIGVRYR